MLTIDSNATSALTGSDGSQPADIRDILHFNTAITPLHDNNKLIAKTAAYSSQYSQCRSVGVKWRMSPVERSELQQVDRKPAFWLRVWRSGPDGPWPTFSVIFFQEAGPGRRSCF